MERYDIINLIIKQNGLKSYLEIGVCDPSICFDKIDCEKKDSVDPGVEYAINPVTYPFTSDDFFKMLRNGELDKISDYKWDIIFIDGLHISDQVLRDVKNSIKHLNPNGYILLHDCNPPDIFYAREDYYLNGQQYPWNGTVWKVLYYLRSNTDLDICTVNTDWGVGIIRNKKQGETRPFLDFKNKFFEYNTMSANRKSHLGLIEVEELQDWLEHKFKI
jgi:hypothetical protein